MSPLDLLIIFIAIFFTALGIYRGLLREILSLVGFVIAIIVASHNYNHLASYLLQWFPKFFALVNILSFVVIFFCVVLLAALVGSVMRRLLIVGDLKLMDRFLGGIFGLIKAFIVNAFIVILIVTFVPQGGKLIKRSPIVLNTYQLTLIAIKCTPDKFKQKYINKWKMIEEKEET